MSRGYARLQGDRKECNRGTVWPYSTWKASRSAYSRGGACPRPVPVSRPVPVPPPCRVRLARQRLEHIAVEAYGPVQVFKADVLVGCVGAACPVGCITGRSETRNPNVAAQRSQQGECAPHNGRYRGPFPGERPGNFNNALHDWRLHSGHDRLCCSKGCNPDVVIPFSRQVGAQFCQNVMWVLVRDETEVDLGACLRWQDRFYAVPGVPAQQPGDVAGGGECSSFAQGRAYQPVHEPFDFVGLPQLGVHVGLIGERCQLFERWRLYRVVESGNADVAIGSAQCRERLDQSPGSAG